MPALKNQRHELFCRNLVEGAQRGWSASEAYVRSGYKADDAAARANASRLLTKDSVKSRLAELTAPAVKKTRTTIGMLAQQFDAVFDGAMGSAQFGAAGSAAAAKSKLLGFMRDRLEVGSVGAFDACETMPQLVEALLADQSPSEALQTCDELREAIELHAATHAVGVIAQPDRVRINETALSLAAIRPQRKNGRGSY
jgi:hypothetical protein